ncbi:E3 ubiquitin-protein ligase RSL1-like [Rhodamnia argentea]|uniref:RBR-type E3 ubiquitin transferase n=1 Tax=Rhodamnia argentea TaxID=178133 RepID=A0A8B8N9Y4_9MYRT|nr:E3 ubiquitin-protein ligase RSL1-like [Rhodamnia argentea]
MGNEAAFDLLSQDDLSLPPLFDEGEDSRDQKTVTHQATDSEYAQGLLFQEVLEVSWVMSMNPAERNTESSSSSVVVVTEANPERSQVKIMDPVETGVRKDGGESSERFCEICAERKEAKEMFGNRTVCSHVFCSLCVTRHVETKVRDNVTAIRCPGMECEGVLQIDSCRQILPENVLCMWEKSLCEAMFLESQKFYCPFKNCSALLIKDCDDEKVIRESECPYCHRLFCAECGVPWHAGVSCEEFQSLNEDERGSEDLVVRELAKEKKWGRCPKCKFYVERTQGCPHIICRCQFQFCYGCGSEWTEAHGGCARN